MESQDLGTFIRLAEFYHFLAVLVIWLDMKWNFERGTFGGR